MPRDALVGTTLAGYTLREMIGEGGTSTVYRGEHAAHGHVAVKVLREKLRQDRTAVARFVREAKFGARVVHPNVVKTIEIGEVEGLHFLTIEWAIGELLEKYVKREAPLPKDEVAAIITQIGFAVAAAHAEGIIHRDLKPDNVMYDPATRQVKLLDFGIAITTDTTADERLTRAGFFVGTLMYVAPEALSGELVGPAADQYSLATIAYQLLTGVLPYTAKNQREMFALLLKEPPTPLNKARPGLAFAPRVEQVVMKGLNKNPNDRFPDVAAFARELDAALQSADPPPDAGIFGKVKRLFS
ncbi:MAG: serine/threonine protein kinase [Gemmatimonadetes bacterium]|nr:serine/threonine protein kinase [Gemmatimonadota bacterium]